MVFTELGLSDKFTLADDSKVVSNFFQLGEESLIDGDDFLNVLSANRTMLVIFDESTDAGIAARQVSAWQK